MLAHPERVYCRLGPTPVTGNLSKGQVAVYVALTWSLFVVEFICSTGRQRVDRNGVGG